MPMKLISALLLGFAIAAPASAAPITGLKGRAVAGVESRAKLAQEVNDMIFSFSELGFQEVETSRYLTDLLEKNGFTVERGTSGLPTGWVARWTGENQLTLDAVLDDMISRCRELDLRAVGSEQKLVMDFTVLLTAKTMHALFGPSRRKWIAL